MASLPRSRTAGLPWHGRLEARVAFALALLVAGALGAMLLITIQLVSTQSRTRAEDELDVARSAFSSLMENRAASSIALATLVTELPVFRAHLTDARLAEDRPTIDAMADGYRRQLEAHFVVVTNGDGAWLANPGWADAATSPPVPLVRLLDAARRGTSGAGIVGRGGELFLAVSVPARFADEVLGTLTTGYRLTDGLAEELARLAQCEVVLISGTQIAATSLKNPAHADTAAAGRRSRVGLLRHVAAGPSDRRPPICRRHLPAQAHRRQPARRAAAAAGGLATDAAVRRPPARALSRGRTGGVWPGAGRRRHVQPPCQPAVARHRGGGGRHRRAATFPCSCPYVEARKTGLWPTRSTR